MTAGTIIIGASHSGVQASQSLRKNGYDLPITLISDEHSLPYHRPPLSKLFLLAPETQPSVLKPLSFYKANEIDLRLGSRVTELDRAQKTVCVGKNILSYKHLILATGASARKLPNARFENILYLRDLADAERLRSKFDENQHLVVIGGGFIGLEVAATARKLGKKVTVVEALDRLLTRSVPARFANHIAERHEKEGNVLIYDTGVARIEGRNNSADVVVLKDGVRLPVDIVVVGIGSIANTSLAQAAGLELCASGIRVNSALRSSDPAIFAIGDCATFSSALTSEPIRLESVQNATDQARSVAAAIAGSEIPCAAVPWFWTDQFDMKIQMAGHPGPETTEILRGDPAVGAFSLLNFKDDELMSAYSLNSAADHITARKLIGSGQKMDIAKAKYTSNKLKDCLSATFT